MEREKQQCMLHKTRQWIVNEFTSSRKKCTDLSTETLSGEIEDCRQCSRERERESAFMYFTVYLTTQMAV